MTSQQAQIEISAIVARLNEAVSALEFILPSEEGEDRWVTIQEAARMLRVSEQYVYKLTRSGRLTAKKQGARSLVPFNQVKSLRNG